MYYLNIQDNKIISCSFLPVMDLLNIEVSEETYNDYKAKPDKYLFKNNEIISEAGYEERKRKEHIEALTCSKRVFALLLKQIGISYAQLKELIATNEDAQLEWDLCGDLLRSNPLIDIMASELGISSEIIDKLFLFANKEIESIDDIIFPEIKEDTDDITE